MFTGPASLATTPGQVSASIPVSRQARRPSHLDSAATTPRNSSERHRSLSGGVKVSEHDDASMASHEAVEKGRDIEKVGETPAGQVSQQQQQQKDPNLVEWDGPDDPENPMNWSLKKKWTATMLLSLMTLTITFASSIFSTATVVVAEQYHISNETSILGTSLFVLGFAFGPLIWGPFSEVFGRMPPLFLGFTVFTIFQIPVAVAQNVETIMLCRFLGGLFGCAPLAVIGGTLTDFWNPVDRGVAVSIFAAATFIGPVAGPIVGGFVTKSHLGWRWTAWITLIMASTFGLLALIFVPETSGQRILQRRAARLRHETKNWALHAKADEIQIQPSDLFTRYLLRPVKMLFSEPILLLVTLYLSLIYGILYLFFEAYPVAFQEQRGWNGGVGALPFLSITIGVIIGAAIVSYITKTRFAHKLEKYGRVVPEDRLPPMMIGAVLLPIGLFWFAWTSSPHITWVPQVIAGIPIGCGVFMVFLQGLNYIIDVYLMYANSGLAANTLVRSLAGAGFPLFANQMYIKLGVDWASSLLAFICVAMIPVPVLFYIYGKRIREWSNFSPT